MIKGREGRVTYATGAFDIQVLLPLMTNPPSTSSTTVSMLAGSEPWLGSVRPWEIIIMIRMMMRR